MTINDKLRDWARRLNEAAEAVADGSPGSAFWHSGDVELTPEQVKVADAVDLVGRVADEMEREAR